MGVVKAVICAIVSFNFFLLLVFTSYFLMSPGNILL